METRSARGQRGFTLVEILIATAIAGILTVMLAGFLRTWARGVAAQGARAARQMCEDDLRRLFTSFLQRGPGPGLLQGTTEWPSIEPWPPRIPNRVPVPWTRPAPGFEQLGFAPTKSPTLLQYRVDGWSTGFVVCALGDTDRDGALELFTIWSDVGMFEGPMPWPPNPASPINP